QNNFWLEMGQITLFLMVIVTGKIKTNPYFILLSLIMKMEESIVFLIYVNFNFRRIYTSITSMKSIFRKILLRN
ncbi:hypothetical protein MOC54_19300, partial [Bacillus spizizenii]|nr:hypothetical protein [Bacillus spizizenii]